MFHLIGVVQSAKGRGDSGGVSNAEISVTDGVARLTYTALTGEQGKPPYINDVVISTNAAYEVNDTLTATIDGGIIGPFTEGTHVYQWYRISNLQGGSLTTISGATNSTYVLQAADETNYIVCAARFVVVGSANTMSPWFYSEPTEVIVADTGGGGPGDDIEHAWEDFLDIESGASVPADWNTPGISPSLVNLGTNANWSASDATKPTFSTDKLVFAGSHRVNGSSQTFPPVCEIWVKGKFTANNGAMIGWGSQTLFGLNSSNQFFVRDTSGITVAGDLNEHVFRIVLNGASSILQIDGGVENTFDENFTSAATLCLGQTFAGGNFADCEIKRFQRTADGTLLTAQEVSDKWAYHGYAI